MINTKKINAIKNYIQNNDNYSKLIICDYKHNIIGVEIANPKLADDDSILAPLLTEIDNITEGNFELIITNRKYISEQEIHIIEQGDIIYEKHSKENKL